MEPELARQGARLARGPELRDVVVAGRFTAEPRSGREVLLVTISATGDRHGALRAPCSPIPPEHHQLVAREQVGQALRLQIVEFDAVTPQREVGEHRARDLRRQRSHDLLDVSPRPDVFRDSAGAVGEPIQEICVHIVPDSEGEDPKRTAAPLGLIGQALGIGLAHRRQSIRQEDDDAEGAFPWLRGQGFGECPRDVGAAAGVEAANPVLRRTNAVGRRVGPADGVAAHPAPERDDAEPVSAAQAAEQLHQRGLRLVELVARHRAGHVEHGDDIAPQRLSHLRGASRCEQQHERAVLPGRLLGEKRHADEPSREGQEQLEIAAGGRVG